MCQLLAMNSNTPTDIVFSFLGFRRRGGLTDKHSDGFGIAFFENKGVRIFQDNNACANSPVADLIAAYPIRSENIIAHIRKATQGDISLQNTQPFMRELWGRYFLFAHNGNLLNFDANGIKNNKEEQGNFYQTVGDTDSEKAFCFILENLRRKYKAAPDNDTLFREISALVKELRKYGLFNFIMSNGEWLFVHCHSLLHYIIREYPFGKAHLSDDDLEVDFSQVTSKEDKVAVIATLPLTDDEKWTQLAVGEILVFSKGKVIFRDVPNNLHYPSKEEGLNMAKQSLISWENIIY